jgi:hypothetical protein
VFGHSDPLVLLFGALCLILLIWEFVPMKIVRIALLFVALMACGVLLDAAATAFILGAGRALAE